MPNRHEVGKHITGASEGTAEPAGSTGLGDAGCTVSTCYKCPAPESLLSHAEDNFMIQKVKNWNQMSLWQGAIDQEWASVWPWSSELHKPSQLCTSPRTGSLRRPGNFRVWRRSHFGLEDRGVGPPCSSSVHYPHYDLPVTDFDVGFPCRVALVAYLISYLSEFPIFLA